MCVTSFVSDYYRPRDNDKTRTWVMNQPIPTVIQYDPEAKELLRKAVELLDKLDKRIENNRRERRVAANIYRME